VDQAGEVLGHVQALFDEGLVDTALALMSGSSYPARRRFDAAWVRNAFASVDGAANHFDIIEVLGVLARYG